MMSRVLEAEAAGRSDSEESTGDSPEGELRGTGLGVGTGGAACACGDCCGTGLSTGGAGRPPPGSVRSMVSASVRLLGRMVGGGPPDSAPCVCSSQLRNSSSSGARALALRNSGSAERYNPLASSTSQMRW